jgi:hypothetical protein
MPRYKAPEHITEVYLSAGTFRADETGHITVPDDLPHHDAVALCAAGFAPAPAGTAPKGKDA